MKIARLFSAESHVHRVLMTDTYIRATIEAGNGSEGDRGQVPEESAMGTVTVYYFTFFDTDKGERVRPRRPGTRAAIAQTYGASATPLMKTAQDVEDWAVDEQGFYPRRAERAPCHARRPITHATPCLQHIHGVAATRS